MSAATSHVVVEMKGSVVFGGCYPFEAYWDGTRVAESDYATGLSFTIDCDPGIHQLECLPQHAGGYVQRFELTIPPGHSLIRTRYSLWWLRYCWSEPQIAAI